MGEDFVLTDGLRLVGSILSFIIVVAGILLVMYSDYVKLEEKLQKEIGGIKKRIFPKIENNIFTFHEWLFEKRTLIGVICIIFGVAMYFVMKGF